METKDEDLMRLYLSGDFGAFEELYRRHAPRVFSFLFKRAGGNRDLTDELHQAVFLKFHQARGQYDFKYPVLQWLFVISKTTLIDFFRKRGREVPTVHDLSPEEIEKNRPPLSQNPDVSALDQLSGALTDEQRKIMEWRFLEDSSYESIAKRLGRSPESVRQTVSRTLKKLRNLVQAKGIGS